MRRLIYALLVLAFATPVGAQSIVFLDAGSAETQDLTFWTTGTGTWSSDGTVSRTNSRSVKVTNGNVSTAAVLTPKSFRASVWMRFDTVPAATTNFLAVSDGTNDGVAFCLDTSAQPFVGSTSGNCGTSTAATGATLSTNTWYRVALAETATTTVLRVFASDGTTQLGSTATSSTAETVTLSMKLILTGAGGAGNSAWWSDVYADDSSAGTDPGNISVTPKKPAALNTNNFDTLGGSGTNRYDRVSDLPLSETNYIQHAASTDVQENFGLQAASAGLVDLTGATIVGRSAWVWAKRGSLAGTITFRTAHSANTTSVAITQPAANDLILVCAYNNASTTIPTLATGYTSLGTLASTLSASRIGFKIAAGTETTSGTWTSATNVTAQIYRGTATLSTGTSVNSSGNGTALSYPALTLGTTDGSSWVAGCGAAKGATAGMTGTTTALVSNRTNQTTVNALDTNGGVTSFAAQTLSVTGSGRWITWSTEIKVAALGAGTPKLMDNGTETAVTLTATPALYQAFTTSATYPSSAAGIGMRSSATAANTFFYEGGTLIAYTPAAGGTVHPMRLPLLGVRDLDGAPQP